MQIFQSAGGVVIGPDGKIAIVNQNGDSWSLPKGHIELGEEPLDAARREIHEETGLDELDLITCLGSYDRPKIALGGKGDDTLEVKHITLFLFTTNQEKLEPIDPDNPEARWIELDEVVSYLSHPKDREFFESIKKQVADFLHS